MDKTKELDPEEQTLGTIGKFRLVKKLGQGGFGEVYKAFDPDLQVFRALKIPHVQSENTGEQLEEARLQAKITHANIVQVHSVEQIEGKWVIVMDYLEGGSLRDRLNDVNPIPVDDAVSYAIQIASALKEAHVHNIVHHDIKPENILFTADGKPKVADFGIARVVRESRPEMSRIMGTAVYMAPEQLEGIADMRSDIWSLGVVLYEMLTGRSCFEANSDPEVLKKIVMETPRPVSELNPMVPDTLNDIVMRMLQKNMEKRYQAMDDVIKDLETFKQMAWVEKRRTLRWVVPVFVAIVLAVGSLIYGAYTGIFDISGLPVIGHHASAAIPQAQVPKEIKALGYNEQVDAAANLIRKGQFAGAFQVLGNVARNAKDKGIRVRAQYMQASLALEYMKKPRLAMHLYKDLIKKYPQSTYAGSAHYFLGWIYYEKKKDLRKAITHLAIVIEHYPDSPERQTAEFLIQDAAKRLAEEGPNVGLVVKSSLGALLPNNIVSLLITLLSLFPLVSMPIAWILTQYHKPDLSAAGTISSRQLARIVMKTPGLRTLIIIIIISQIISFSMTRYQSKHEYISMVNAIKHAGVTMDVSR